jgi:hypothetical protein
MCRIELASYVRDVGRVIHGLVEIAPENVSSKFASGIDAAITYTQYMYKIYCRLNELQVLVLHLPKALQTSGYGQVGGCLPENVPWFWYSRTSVLVLILYY